MKNCEKLHALLPLYQEKQLSARDQASVAKHLSVCAEAREELKQLDRLGKALKTLPEPKIPHDLHEKIMARVHGKPAPVKNHFWLKTASGLAAAAGLGFLFFAQNYGWFGNSQDALKAKNITALIRPLPQNLGVDINFKSVVIQPSPQTTAITLALKKPLDPRLTIKGVTGITRNVDGQKELGLEYALKSTRSNAVPMGQFEFNKATQPMVMASGSTLLRSKTQAFQSDNRNLDYDANTSTNGALAAPQANFGTGVNDDAQIETNIALNTRAVLPDVMHADRGDKQTPKFLRFDTLQIGLNKYQLLWQTDLVTKGQLFIMDSTGNTLQALSEKGQYAYDHQMVVDNTPANKGFSIKLLVTYLNGNQAVTFFNQPPNPTPTP